MKLFRLLFDSIMFLIPLIYPVPILLGYIIVHIWFPFIIKLPRYFDTIDHPYNVQIPGTYKLIKNV